MEQHGIREYFVWQQSLKESHTENRTEQNKIKNKLSNENIKSSNVILFVTDKSVEDIEEIERFIDCEYYEVEPKFVIENPINVINEIATDLN